MNVAELIELLQDLDLPEAELEELTELLTTQGITEPVRRRVRSVLVQTANRELADLEKYEKAYDILKLRDQKVQAANKKTEQALNRVDMTVKAKLGTLKRHVSEDVDAAKSGATLLLHTDDVAPSAEFQAELAADVKPIAPAELSPKQAAATVIAAAKAKPDVQPTTTPLEPSSPSLPWLPKNEPLPATVAPLPPTPIAPPVVPNATAAQPLTTPPAMTEPA